MLYTGNIDRMGTTGDFPFEGLELLYPESFEAGGGERLLVRAENGFGTYLWAAEDGTDACGMPSMGDSVVMACPISNGGDNGGDSNLWL